jgi:hypothetical protein
MSSVEKKIVFYELLKVSEVFTCQRTLARVLEGTIFKNYNEMTYLHGHHMQN